MLEKSAGVLFPMNLDGALRFGVILLRCGEVRISFFFFPQNGEIQPVSVKVGEKVLLPEYGGTKIVLEDKVGVPAF